MTDWILGVIGGSGLYEIDGLRNQCWVKIDSPWGAPSDEVLQGDIGGVRVVFLPRHGRNHRLPPSAVNARANIDVLKRAGCTDILSVSAVGSLDEKLAPGSFVVVDQYIDRTFARPKSFFDVGFVAHVSMANPVCPRLSSFEVQAGRRMGLSINEGAIYLAMEGPQFSTRSESDLYRSWGCKVVGMTAMPEAKLAREAELPYANLCMVTDYDCWREESAHVEVASVLAVMQQNAENARRLIGEFVRALQEPRAASPIDTCLDNGVVSDPSIWNAHLVVKLDAICRRYFENRQKQSPTNDPHNG